MALRVSAHVSVCRAKHLLLPTLLVIAVLQLLLVAVGWPRKVAAAQGTLDTLGDVTIRTDTMWPEGVYEADNLTIADGATLTVGGGSTITVTGEVSLVGGSTLLGQGKNVTGLVEGRWQGVGITINVGRVVVEAGSVISANGQGYTGTAGPGAGESDNGCNASTAGGGGAYGGSGGATPRTRGGDPYGSPLMPVDLGSGGGNNPGCSQISTANAGGGAIRLNVSGVLQLGGAITADAASGLATRLGGGAGGSIYVTAGTLTGAGVFSANGADSGSVNAGGGGGGRIVVYYAAGGSFAGFVGSMANGGNGILPGAPGSVAFIDTSLPNHHLWVYQSLVFGEDTVLAYDALTLVNGATLRLGGGSTLDVAGEIVVRQNSMVVTEGKNTTQLVDGRWQGSGVTISAGRLTIETASSISADGHGYAGTAGPGAGASETGCNAAAGGGGGGYGGRGGRGTAAGGEPYGLFVAPADLGSGGGNNPGCGVRSTANIGGGAIRLSVSDVLQLDGTITANGATAVPERLGGGAGGSIYVTTRTLTGGGSFAANGAAAGSETAGGGGGGRVAVSYEDAPAFAGFIASTANGGSGLVAGEPGTVVFTDTASGGARLFVYQNLVFDEDASIAYDAITLDNGAALRVGGGSTLTIADTLVVRGDSTIILESKNTVMQVDGVWQGAGVTINAGNVEVEAGSVLSADGQGYRGTAGPGVGASDPECNASAAGAGGGHGGNGGATLRGLEGGVANGSAAVPTELGSGGGNNPGCGVTSTANAGGGAIRMNISGALRLDGAITADAAADTPERLGGGAGGSLYVTAGTLIGSGIFSADGADAGSANAGGGAGGRVAVSYASGAAFRGVALSTVSGGAGHAPGEDGTIRFTDTVCDGDCNGDQSVTVDELVRGVNMALGTLPASACSAIDSDGVAGVTIDDLLRAVNRALSGCSF